MTPENLAHELLRCTSNTALLVPGHIISRIGSDALQDALNRGWVTPNLDTGMLMLTDQQSKLQDMRKLSESFGTGLSANVNSSSAPGSGQPPRPSVAKSPMDRPNLRATSDYAPNEDVVVRVAEEGNKAYQAKVHNQMGDGTYRLTFGPNKPANSARSFRREEIQRLVDLPPQQQWGRSQSTTPPESMTPQQPV